MSARRLVALAVVSALAAACVTRTETVSTTVQGDELRREEPIRPAANLPATFTVVTKPSTPRDCPPVLRDNELDTRLTLRRSLLIPVRDSTGVAYAPFGDYAMEPVARYGAAAGEGLRIDCTRLRALGIVTLH